jgi:DNA-binding protein H-NS
MTKTYTQLQQQIAKLQQEAEAIKAKEVSGVIGRIQEAIQHYGLTVGDLFPQGSSRRGRSAQAAAKTTEAAKGRKAKRQPAPAKYTDGQGKTWNGIGKRPGWFVSALAGGKTAKDLEIGAPQS